MEKHLVKQRFKLTNFLKHYLPPDNGGTLGNPYRARDSENVARMFARLSWSQLNEMTARFPCPNTVTYMEAFVTEVEHELWKLAEVASYWRCSPNSARTRLSMIGSPAAIQLPGSRTKLYAAEAVREWTLRHTEQPGEITGAASAKRLRGPRKVA